MSFENWETEVPQKKRRLATAVLSFVVIYLFMVAIAYFSRDLTEPPFGKSKILSGKNLNECLSFIKNRLDVKEKVVLHSFKQRLLLAPPTVDPELVNGYSYHFRESYGIYIPEITLKKLDESNICAMIAHEVGHIKAGHFDPEQNIFLAPLHIWYVTLKSLASLIYNLAHPAVEEDTLLEYVEGESVPDCYAAKIYGREKVEKFLDLIIELNRKILLKKGADFKSMEKSIRYRKTALENCSCPD